MVVEYDDQWCIGFFLLELESHKERLLKDNNTTKQAHQQKTFMTLLSPITPHASNQSWATWPPD